MRELGITVHTHTYFQPHFIESIHRILGVMKLFSTFMDSAACELMQVNAGTGIYTKLCRLPDRA
ncbi:unnamed protein product [Heterobilharzia americana]|nr:unnamed protein product [Heterobilharzia americana]